MNKNENEKNRYQDILEEGRQNYYNNFNKNENENENENENDYIELILCCFKKLYFNYFL